MCPPASVASPRSTHGRDAAFAPPPSVETTGRGSTTSGHLSATCGSAAPPAAGPAATTYDPHVRHRHLARPAARRSCPPRGTARSTSRSRARAEAGVAMLDRPGPGRIPARPAAAIVLAAGEGTRMRSAVPKVLHPIAGRSLLGHAVHAVAALEPEHLVVVVGHGARAGPDGARRARRASSAARSLVAEQEQRLGTGHAVRCALDALPADLTGPVLVTYGDVPLLEPGHAGRAARRARRRRRARSPLLTSRAGRPHRLRADAARRRAGPSPASSSTPTPPPSSGPSAR